MLNNTTGKVGFHHIALRVKDMQIAKQFYMEGLGFILKGEWRDGETGLGCMVDIGDGGIIEMFDGWETDLDKSFDRQAGSFFHLAISVEDVDAVYKRALECGAKPQMEPKNIVIPASPPIPARIAFVCGPSGESVELFKNL